MKELHEFIADPRLHKPFWTTLGQEDEIQDPDEYRRREKEYQAEEYAKYCLRFEPQEKNGSTTEEENRVVAQLSKLTNSKVVQPVVQPKTASSTTKKDAKWWREYREGLKLNRGKPGHCQHCGKKL